MTENLKKNATFGFAFTASLPGCIRHPQKNGTFLVFTPASASVLHFVTFPLRTLSTQKLLKAVIWKWDTVLNSKTHLSSRHFFSPGLTCIANFNNCFSISRLFPSFDSGSTLKIMFLSQLVHQKKGKMFVLIQRMCQSESYNWCLKRGVRRVTSRLH